jgi:ribulose-phosphate 3-epimerase
VSDSHGIKLAASILSADYASLGEQVSEVSKAGVDYIHVDIMDGHFVPALTWGPGTVEAIRKWTNLPIDVHMMVEKPENHIDSFVQAGADIITVHQESAAHLHRIVAQIRDRGVSVGVAINPGTPILAIEEVLHLLDVVLVMTVNPGFPGQKFVSGIEHKVARAREIIDRTDSKAMLEVDGGINPSTASLVVGSGARMLVAGSAVFDHESGVFDAVHELRESIGGG